MRALQKVKGDSSAALAVWGCTCLSCDTSIAVSCERGGSGVVTSGGAVQPPTDL